MRQWINLFESWSGPAAQLRDNYVAWETNHPGCEIDFSVRSPTHIHIESVDTPVEQRSKGYATRALRQIQKLADQFGVIVSLHPAWTDEENDQRYDMFGFYENLGFRDAYDLDREFDDVDEGELVYLPMTLQESRLEKWSKETIRNIDDNAQSRFEALEAGFSKLGAITDDRGDQYDLWGTIEPDMIRLYATTVDKKLVSYIQLRDIGVAGAEHIMIVKMVFTRPQFQKRGIGRALYDFVLDKGYALMSDETLTTASRAIWKAFINDPRIEVTYAEYDRFDRKMPTERPLKSLSVGMRRHMRMIARRR